MAFAEGRAAWQRTANRYLIQEDAKRAPKLACCSTSSPSVKQDDVGPANAARGEDTPSIGCLPNNEKPSHVYLSPNSRWWLQQQPNFGCQKGLMNEQFSSHEMNMEIIGIRESTSLHLRNEDDVGFDQTTYRESFRDNHSSRFETCEKKDARVKEQELRALYAKNSQDPLELEGAIDVSELTRTDFVGCKVSKKFNELHMDSNSSWIGAEKNEPWWRTADTEELALLVAQRSLDLENCDLPQPHNTRVRKELYSDAGLSDCGRIYTSSLDLKPDKGSYRNLTTYKPCSLTEESVCQKRQAAVKGPLLCNANKSNSGNPTQRWAPLKHTSEKDPSKAQLLEALRHSQTRAREAEKVAKLACAEKEHIVKLVFRQASQLFAYKQWFQLLQLENIYFQMKKNNGQPKSALFPLILPSVPQRTRKMRKSWQKSGRGKRARKSRYEFNISKYAIVFAFGLGLVGAGLLLGWTVGLMLPTL